MAGGNVSCTGQERTVSMVQALVPELESLEKTESAMELTELRLPLEAPDKMEAFMV